MPVISSAIKTNNAELFGLASDQGAKNKAPKLYTNKASSSNEKSQEETSNNDTQYSRLDGVVSNKTTDSNSIQSIRDRVAVERATNFLNSTRPGAALRAGGGGLSLASSSSSGISDPGSSLGSSSTKSSKTAAGSPDTRTTNESSENSGQAWGNQGANQGGGSGGGESHRGDGGGESHGGGTTRSIPQNTNFNALLKELKEMAPKLADYAQVNGSASRSVGLMDDQYGNHLTRHLITQTFDKGRSLADIINNDHGSSLGNYGNQNLKLTTGEKKVADDFGTKDNPLDFAIIITSKNNGSDGHMFGLDEKNSAKLAEHAGAKAENIFKVTDYGGFMKAAAHIMKENMMAVAKGEEPPFKNGASFQYNHGNLEGKDVSNPGGDGGHNAKDSSFFAIAGQTINEALFEQTLGALQASMKGDLASFCGSCHGGGFDGDVKDDGIDDIDGVALSDLEEKIKEEANEPEAKNASEDLASNTNDSSNAADEAAKKNEPSDSSSGTGQGSQTA
jgi:cytochrome c553